MGKKFTKSGKVRRKTMKRNARQLRQLVGDRM